MAYHVHRQIRGAVVTLLTGLATTGTRVYANRLRPMQDSDLPGLRVFLDDESAEAATADSPTTIKRTITLVVEACAKYSAGLDDSLDQMSKEVEVALKDGATIAGRYVPISYIGMAFTDEQSDRPIGVKRMSLNVEAYTKSDAPDTLV